MASRLDPTGRASWSTWVTGSDRIERAAKGCVRQKNEAISVETQLRLRSAVRVGREGALRGKRKHLVACCDPRKAFADTLGTFTSCQLSYSANRQK
jgi:hypothetical protein